MSGLLVVEPTGHERHDPGAGHPERPGRVAAARDGIELALAGAGQVRFMAGRPATLEDVALVHDRAYLDGLMAVARAGGGELDPDTPMGPASWSVAMDSAGLGLVALDELGAGTASAAFVLPRPPGHHASATMGMGFCLLNNVAVTAARLRARGERVLVVDWDVHHGNGTQAIFWDDPDVMFCSLHQSPAYPGSGRADDVGGISAPGGIVNVPLPAGATGDVLLAAVEHVIAPAADRFSPDWLLISAGFDAHRDDPLAELCLTAGDFGLLAERVAELAPGPARTIAFLEGGYHPDALARSVGAVAAALVGARHHPEAPTVGGPGRDWVDDCVRRRMHALELAW